MVIADQSNSEFSISELATSIDGNQADHVSLGTPLANTNQSSYDGLLTSLLNWPSIP